MLSFFSDDLEAYISRHSAPESDLLAELTRFTREKTTAPNMLSGHIVGRFLKLLVQMTRSKNILEVGTFTGYATLCLAEGTEALGGKVTTLEFDPGAASKARSFFKKSPYDSFISLELGPALDSIDKLSGPFDLVFIDADKVNYTNYFNKLMEQKKVVSGSLLIFDNCLWSGEVLNPKDNSSKALCELNQTLHNDPRVENVLLSVRDGLHLALVR